MAMNVDKPLRPRIDNIQKNQLHQCQRQKVYETDIYVESIVIKHSGHGLNIRKLLRVVWVITKPAVRNSLWFTDE